MNKHRIIACLVLLIAANVRADGIQRSTTGRDWVTWLGPFSNRTTDEHDWDPQALNGETPISWRTNIGKGHGMVSVLGERVYVFGNKKCEFDGKSSNGDVVACLDAKTGEEIWHYAYPSRPGNTPGPRSTPVIDEGYVYTHSRHGEVLCLDAATGKVKWSKQLRDLGYRPPAWGFTSSTVFHKDTLLIRIGDAGIALDKHSGRKIWSGDTSIKSTSESTPVFFTLQGKTVAALVVSKALKVVNIQTGAVLRQFPWSYTQSDPSVIQGHLLLSNSQKGSVLLDVTADPPQPVWQNGNVFGSFQGFVIYKNLAFGFGRRADSNWHQFAGHFQCVNVDDGTLTWEHDLGLWGSMILAHDKLIVISGDGRLIIAEPTNKGFTPLSSAQIHTFEQKRFQKNLGARCWTMPVLSHGHIYVRTTDGELACVDMRAY